MRTKRYAVCGRCQTLPYHNRAFDGLSSLVAKGHVESIWLVRVGADERRKTSEVRIPLTWRPDRIHGRCDCDELSQMGLERAVVHGREQQADAARSPIRIVQDGKPREVDVVSAQEIDVRARRSGGHPFAGDVVTDGAQHVSQMVFLARSYRGKDGETLWRHTLTIAVSADGCARCGTIIGHDLGCGKDGRFGLWGVS